MGYFIDLDPGALRRTLDSLIMLLLVALIAMSGVAIA